MAGSSGNMPSFAPVEVGLMRRALSLAALGRATAPPNPLVGAVVAKRGRVLGQGFHRRPGDAHAEMVALAAVGRGARGATLYTSLEPCCHTGRTPPCVDEIVRAGVTEVVAAMRDPNPRVDGGGFGFLRRHGVGVRVGLLAEEAHRLNAAFVKNMRRGLPFVTLKGAASLDGRIATASGQSKWITSAAAREHARALRSEHEAVLVGIGTVLADDPRLDRRPRLRGSAEIVRVVLDGTLRIEEESRLVRTAGSVPLVVCCGPRASKTKRRRLEDAGVSVETLPRRGGRLELGPVLERLYARGISRVLVEGGGEVHASFLAERLADRLTLYLAPRLLGGRNARPLVGGAGVAAVHDAYGLDRSRCARVGDGWMIDAFMS